MTSDRAPAPTRLTARRTVFLLAGAAVAAAFVVLASALTAPLQPTERLSLLTFVAILVGLMAGAGLLPGVREVEVAGAQALLGVPDHEIVVPEPMRWAHRWRTALWTLVHQVAGALTGLLLVLSVVAVLGLVAMALGGDPFEGTRVRPPSGPAEWSLAAVAVTALVTVAALIVLGLGRAAAASAPALLGPLGEDRLQIAEQRLAREREHRRLSRDLHDGVGHSLSAISLQAAAGRRSLQRGTDPARIAETLRTVEELAGRAVAELDSALAVLRREADPASVDDPVASRRPVGTVGELDLTSLHRLVEEHRARGMDLLSDLPVPERLAAVPAVVSRTAYRICGEALANAAKHGAAAGPVELAVVVGDPVRVLASNPVAADAAPAQANGAAGHGLAGLRETVRLVGGSLRTGVVDGRWTVDAELPGGSPHG